MKKGLKDKFYENYCGGFGGPEIGLSEGTYLTYNSINFRWI